MPNNAMKGQAGTAKIMHGGPRLTIHNMNKFKQGLLLFERNNKYISFWVEQQTNKRVYLGSSF